MLIRLKSATELWPLAIAIVFASLGVFTAHGSAAQQPAALKHGTGYIALTQVTSWVNGDRTTVSTGQLDPTVTDTSTRDGIDRRYDKGLRSAPANRPSRRFVWSSRLDDENGTNVTGNALRSLFDQGQLGSRAVWDGIPTAIEIADAGATGDPRVLAYYRQLPTDPSQAVPMPLPGKPCGVSVQDIGGGFGLRLVNNTSPLCVNPNAPPAPAAPGTPPVVAPSNPGAPPAAPDCSAWLSSFKAWLAAMPPAPTSCGGTK